MNSENLIKNRKYNFAARRRNRIGYSRISGAAGKNTGVDRPNGAGKSTLLLMLAGLLKQQKGKLYFQGQPVESRAGSGHVTPQRCRCVSRTSASE